MLAKRPLKEIRTITPTDTVGTQLTRSGARKAPRTWKRETSEKKFWPSTTSYHADKELVGSRAGQLANRALELDTENRQDMESHNVSRKIHDKNKQKNS
jgi:hypothetical protein